MVMAMGSLNRVFLFSELEGVWPVSGVQCKVCACLAKCGLHEEVRLWCACELKFYVCVNISEAIEDTQTNFSKFYLTFI